MIAAAVVAGACGARLREGVQIEEAGVLFRLKHPSASSVAVAGDFNGWSETSHPMTRQSEVWSRVVPLPPGDYLFMYVVDGSQWLAPRNAPELVPDGFGGMNGKVTVP